MSSTPQTLGQTGAREHNVRFAEQVGPGDVVWMSFKDPTNTYAVLLQKGSVLDSAGQSADDEANDLLDVVVLPPGESTQKYAEWMNQKTESSACAASYLKTRGYEVWWRPGKAILQCEAEQADSLLSAIAEFSHYERELRRTEREIADSWQEVEEDKALAFEVTPADLRRTEVTSARMARTFHRRIRQARIEPHLYAPNAVLPLLAQKLGQELREEMRVEARCEALDGQMEVFEHIYEMGSQRIGEYQASKQGHSMELIIIWLLAAEALLMLVQAILAAKS